ncbi:MAG: hypothetical protein GY927_09545 [bacterium]|nr:hypothetical protein [bacterium]
MSAINDRTQPWRWWMRVGIFLLIPSLSACQQYRDRSDKITLQLGDAVAVNSATHIINPWPPAAYDQNIDMDGKKALIAHKRYRSNKMIPPKLMRADSKETGD